MAPTIGDFFTAVPGTIHATTIPAAVGEILVRNDSPYDLWIAYNNQPSAAPGPLTFSQYAAEVTPGREQITPPPQFNGRMWIGCYNPGGKAASGTISSRANVYVRWYPVGESAGAGAAYSALTGLDTTSQQRVISIPTEPHIYGDYAILFSSLSNVDTNIPITSGRTFDGTQYVTVYVYGFSIGVRQARYAYGELEIGEFDAGHILGAVHAVTSFDCRSQGQFVPILPSSPLPLRFQPAATTTSLDFVISIVDAWPAPADSNTILRGSIFADIDLTGQTPPPAIGNGAGTPPGAIY